MKLQHYLKIALCLLVTMPLSTKAANSGYKLLESISGMKERIVQVLVNKRSLALNLEKTSNIRIRIRPEDVYKTKTKTGSIKIEAYDIKNGNRDFISSQTVTLFKGNKRNKVISIDVGFFDKIYKNVELDVFGTDGDLIGTYAMKIDGYNVARQKKSRETISSANCDPNDFGECQLDYILSNLSFEMKPLSTMSTRIVKEDAGYKVIIPVKSNKTRKRGFRRKLNNKISYTKPDGKPSQISKTRS